MNEVGYTSFNYFSFNARCETKHVHVSTMQFSKNNIL